MSKWLNMLLSEEVKTPTLSTPKTGKSAFRGFPGSLPKQVSDFSDVPDKLERACIAVEAELGLRPNVNDVVSLLSDWIDENAHDFVYGVGSEELRSSGIAPPHFTATTNCRGCGPVPIFEGSPQEVDICPWCRNRVEGLPMPRISG